MVRILMPSDFSETSVRHFKSLKEYFKEDFDILFTHLFYLPDGIQDLLFSSYRLREYDFITDHFLSEYKKLEFPVEISDKTEMPVLFFYGNTLAHFKNFLRANAIDLIAYSEKDPVSKLSKASIVPLNKIIRKCGIPLLNLDTINNQQKQHIYAAQNQHTF